MAIKNSVTFSLYIFSLNYETLFLFLQFQSLFTLGIRFSTASSICLAASCRVTVSLFFFKYKSNDNKYQKNNSGYFKLEDIM